MPCIWLKARSIMPSAFLVTQQSKPIRSRDTRSRSSFPEGIVRSSQGIARHDSCGSRLSLCKPADGTEEKTAHSGVSRTTSTNPEFRTQRENSKPQRTRTHAGSRRIIFPNVTGTDDPRQLMKEWWHPLGVWEATDKEGNTCHSLQCEGRVPISPVSFSHQPRELHIQRTEFETGHRSKYQNGKRSTRSLGESAHTEWNMLGPKNKWFSYCGSNGVQDLLTH